MFISHLHVYSILRLGLRTEKDLPVVRYSLPIAMISPWRNEPFGSGSELELNLRDSHRAHNWNLIPSPSLLSPCWHRFGFQVPISPGTVGNYSNNTKSPECAVYTLFMIRSSVAGCIVLWWSSEEKPLRISFFSFLRSPASLAWVLTAIPIGSKRYGTGFVLLLMLPQQHKVNASFPLVFPPQESNTSEQQSPVFRAMMFPNPDARLC